MGEYENNHFLQKALVKNFAQNGWIKWIRWGTSEKGIFNIKDRDYSKHPIVKKEYFSKEIEKGMNDLESSGIKIIRKIALQANANFEIELSRKELFTIRWFQLLSSARTDKFRNNITLKNGDPLFNEMMSKDARKPQEIQEEWIGLILKYYKKYKNSPLDGMGIIRNKLKNKNTIEQAVLINIFNIWNSRLIVFKFDVYKLFLLEAAHFAEYYPNGAQKLTFMPIAPNVGICFYYDSSFVRGFIPLKNSIIFKSNIAEIRNKVIYVNQKSPEDKVVEYSLKDKYIYQILNEDEEVADFCNAMALVHNKNQILIYQNEKDIEDAEQTIKIRKIRRAEDSF